MYEIHTDSSAVLPKRTRAPAPPPQMSSTFDLSSTSWNILRFYVRFSHPDMEVVLDYAGEAPDSADDDAGAQGGALTPSSVEGTSSEGDVGRRLRRYLQTSSLGDAGDSWPPSPSAPQPGQSPPPSTPAPVARVLLYGAGMAPDSETVHDWRQVLVPIDPSYFVSGSSADDSGDVVERVWNRMIFRDVSGAGGELQLKDIALDSYVKVTHTSTEGNDGGTSALDTASLSASVEGKVPPAPPAPRKADLANLDEATLLAILSGSDSSALDRSLTTNQTTAPPPRPDVDGSSGVDMSLGVIIVGFMAATLALIAIIALIFAMRWGQCCPFLKWCGCCRSGAATNRRQLGRGARSKEKDAEMGSEGGRHDRDGSSRGQRFAANAMNQYPASSSGQGSSPESVLKVDIDDDDGVASSRFGSLYDGSNMRPPRPKSFSVTYQDHFHFLRSISNAAQHRRQMLVDNSSRRSRRTSENTSITSNTGKESADADKGSETWGSTMSISAPARDDKAFCDDISEWPHGDSGSFVDVSRRSSAVAPIVQAMGCHSREHSIGTTSFVSGSDFGGKSSHLGQKDVVHMTATQLAAALLQSESSSSPDDLSDSQSTTTTTPGTSVMPPSECASRERAAEPYVELDPEEFNSQIVLKEVLGTGASGVVHLAAWVNRKNDVAVKVLHGGGVGMSQHALDEFRREVEILKGINHPHIVRLFGACLTPPRMALVQEYVQGGSLHEVLHGSDSAVRHNFSYRSTHVPCTLYKKSSFATIRAMPHPTLIERGPDQGCVCIRSREQILYPSGAESSL